MPMSQGVVSANMPGLELKAWAVVDIGTLTIKKGFNVASFTGSSGTYTVNFQNALANTDYFLTGRPIAHESLSGSTTSHINCNSQTVNSFVTSIFYGGAAVSGIFYFAIWA